VRPRLATTHPGRSPHTVYSSAVTARDLVFVGLHRGFGEDFCAQLTGAIEGMRGTLAAHGAELQQLVKVNVWLKDVTDLPAMEKAFFDHFPEGGFPARMTSTTEFIDDDCLVMVEGIAYRG